MVMICLKTDVEWIKLLLLISIATKTLLKFVLLTFKNGE